MNLKIFLYRLAAVVTTFLLGVGIFSAAQSAQSFFRSPEIGGQVQPVVKREVLFVPPLVVPPLYVPTGETIADSEEKPAAADYNGGDYYLIGEPKGFKDFDVLSIATQNYENATEANHYQGVPMPPEGFVLTSKQFDFKRIAVGGRQIAFETEAKKGISYKFVGEFIDGEEIKVKTAEGEEYTGYAVLKGRLIKMRDGKKIAETEARFGESGC